MPFLQFGTAKKCAGIAKFAIGHSDELANFRAVGMTSFYSCQSCGLATLELLILPLTC